MQQVALLGAPRVAASFPFDFVTRGSRTAWLLLGILTLPFVSITLYEWYTEKNAVDVGEATEVQLAIEPPYVGQGEAAVPYVELVVVGAVFSLFAAGYFLAHEPMRKPGLACMVVMFACWGCALPGLIDTLMASKSSYAVPGGRIPEAIEMCACIVFDGLVELFPIVYSIVSVVIQFALNYAYTLAKEKLWSKTGKSMTELMVGSVQTPSVPIYLLTAAYHVFHCGQLFLAGVGYSAMFMTLFNSGMIGFMVLSMYALVYPCGYSTRNGLTTEGNGSDAMGGRAAVGLVFFLLLLPGYLRNVVPGMIRWPSISIPVEIVAALLIVVFFPEPSRNFVKKQAEKTWGAENPVALWRKEGKVLAVVMCVSCLVMLVLFPLQTPVTILCEKLGFLRNDVSPFAQHPILLIFILGIFVTFRCITIQMYYDFSELNYLGVSYWDAMYLSYTARHWRCQICLFTTSVARTQVAAARARANIQAAAFQMWSFLV